MQTKQRPTEKQRTRCAAHYANLYSLRLRVLDAIRRDLPALADQLTTEAHRAAPYLYKVHPGAWGGLITTKHLQALASLDRADIQAERLAARLDRMARDSSALD